MSIAEGENDWCSSASSDLQDDYDEVLHLKQLGTSDMAAHRRASQRKEDRRSQLTAVEEMAFQSSSRVSVLSNAADGLHPVPERSISNSPDHLQSAVTDIFVSEEKIGKMENILDIWSNNLKSNVLTELRKWKLTFQEQHRLEIRKQRKKHEAQTAALKSELESLKELVHTYEISNQRKDEVIANMNVVLDKQNDKLEKMRAFTHWRLRHTEAKEEALSSQVASQHYSLQLKKKVWLGWHSLVTKHWKVKVEDACRARAEELCTHLSVVYEAKIAQYSEAIEKAQAEIQRLRVEREQYEESMKKAFMRGICALNNEALSMFHGVEERPEQAPVHDQHDIALPQGEPGSTTMAHSQPHHMSSSQFSPVHFDHLDPSRNQVQHIFNLSSGGSVSRVHPSSTVGHSSLPPGGTASSHRQVSERVVTASQEKHSKTITARITARNDVGKTVGSKLQLMGVAPPITSVMVERHHPVTQLTIGQATAAKSPHSSQQGHRSTGGRSSSRTSMCHVHSIKVVD